jgi:hypothetical protein
MAMQKPCTRRIAGVEVQTVHYGQRRAVYVMGEELSTGVHAAGVIYEMYRASGRA